MLQWKLKSEEELPVYYVNILEEIYDVIKRVNTVTDHGSRDMMPNTKYGNIANVVVKLFKPFCAVRLDSETTSDHRTVVKPILSKDFCSQSQVDLVDVQASSQTNYKWIVIYQCHLTKFYILRGAG